MTTTQRVTRGFDINEDGSDTKPSPRRVRTRQQIMAGEGKRPPAAVALSALAHNPFNPRDELTDIDETAASLRERGQLQPVAVVRTAAFLAVHGDQAEQLGEAEYVVIDGNRRLAAAHVAGLTELRIDVNDALAASVADILEAALIANVHRVDVPPLDQAKAIQDLISVHGTQLAVAKRLGKTAGWVSQRLALLKLPDDLQRKVDTGELPVREGRRIGGLPAAQQHAEASLVLSAEKPAPKPRVRRDGKATGAPAPAVALPDQPKGEREAAPKPSEDVYPVNPAADSADVPDLPWADPHWFNARLREHMSAEHREELTLLLMADS
ncbi:Chromosome-partitioning protein Spo0J [Streptomyces sp. ADI91-18]|uniref:ParB/RepB/Spo0J family partition protein n=1 Tax=Streptomyces sp. ADI91-18 TaxID=1522755 RepID=UPI000F5524AC|nr:ParB/RepB/Spo0J family partition protein [Streptomyces sp. ADI91-18]RPK23578.1 Chromosome-partitioning protein Spo0J [Streptomyces sp. ADI91-18]